MKRAPYTWCDECDTVERCVVDLSRFGLDTIPVLGWHFAARFKRETGKTPSEYTRCQARDILGRL